MPFTGFADEAFTFYEGLRADNSKTYWTKHKEIYESAVRAPMLALLEQLAPEFGGDPVMFRPYRDVRFSKDKSPYKTAQGGFVEASGGVGYYLQLDAEGVLVGGGFHARDREQTARYRSAVDDATTGGELARITTALEKAGFEVGGDQVRTRPRGVAPDHPRLDLMRREFLTVGRQLPASPAMASKAFATSVKKDWKSVRPLIEWISEHVAPTT
jgi:uncharacterized protein (TIGR02453 family)